MDFARLAERMERAAAKLNALRDERLTPDEPLCEAQWCLVDAARAFQALPTEALPHKVVPLKLMELRECFHFWQHYASLSEGEQDDMNEQRMTWLARMRGWCYFTESPLAPRGCPNCHCELCRPECHGLPRREE